MSTQINSFVDIAAEYCKFVENQVSDSIIDMLNELSVLLAQLYVTAIQLPDVEPSERDSETQVVTTPYISFDGFDAYWEMFDPYDAEQPVCGSLSDDILDIYRDIKRGLLVYQGSIDGDKANAVWHWKFHFHSHWGYHLVDALRAIHWAKDRI